VPKTSSERVTRSIEKPGVVRVKEPQMSFEERLLNPAKPACLSDQLNPNRRKSPTRQLPLPRDLDRFAPQWGISPMVFEITIVCGNFAQ
jgi:hypothetical protein